MKKIFGKFSSFLILRTAGDMLPNYEFQKNTNKIFAALL